LIGHGLGEGLVEKLKAAGVNTVESLADMTPEQLEAIEGIGPKTWKKSVLRSIITLPVWMAARPVAAAEPENSGEAATEAVLSEESLAEGTVEADALAAEPDSAGEAESPVDGELEAAKLAAEAEPPSRRRKKSPRPRLTKPRLKKPRKTNRADPRVAAFGPGCRPGRPALHWRAQGFDEVRHASLDTRKQRDKEETRADE